MNLTKIAFTYRKSVFMVLFLLLVNGVFAYLTLPAQENPTITIREATVTTSYPGMSPERIEQLITRALEKEIRKIPEVEKLRSTSVTGQSVIHIEIYDRYFNLDNIWQDLRNKVSQVQANLPEGTQTSFVNDSFGDVSVVTLALTADGFSLGEMLLSPKKGEFMGNIAPADKKAMYLGFVMLPQGIGWTLEGKLGPWLYDVYASKDLLAKEYLQQLGMAADKVSKIKNGEAFDILVDFTGQSAQTMTDTLYQANNIAMTWYIIATVGAISGVGIYLYGKWVYRLQAQVLPHQQASRAMSQAT